jgi:shikimate dehydrogenase
VASRNPERAAALAAEARIGWLPLDEIARQRFDVIVHCTPAGSRTAPNEIAVPLAVVRSAKVVIEAVYRPSNTPLVEAARAAGVDVVLGSDWFLAQAIEQALHFSSTNSDARALMQAELERALAEDGT